jgi:hypothetical protein
MKRAVNGDGLFTGTGGRPLSLGGHKVAHVERQDFHYDESLGYSFYWQSCRA